VLWSHATCFVVEALTKVCTYRRVSQQGDAVDDAQRRVTEGSKLAFTKSLSRCIESVLHTATLELCRSSRRYQHSQMIRVPSDPYWTVKAALLESE
jgi:hypothetical protein